MNLLQIEWFGEIYDVPDVEELYDKWIFNKSWTPEGEEVEHDDPSSWLSILGYV